MHVPTVEPSELPGVLERWGVQAGTPVGLCLRRGVGVGLAFGEDAVAVTTGDPVGALTPLMASMRPRWVWWSCEEGGAAELVAGGVRPATCWDVAAVHRVLHGGWRAEPARLWAWLHDLDPATIPALGQLDLLGSFGGDDGDADQPVRPDGHLRPEWVGGGWHDSPTRLALWARAALRASSLQMQRLQALDVVGDAMATARAESTVELLCTELAHDGLPIDVEIAEAIMAASVGPRPRSSAEADAARAARDAAVLAHVPHSSGLDLRNPADVKSLLRRVGIDVTDTRAWRLEQMREVHPVVDALLTWRKAERIATTFGYGWLDEHVHGGRLRGAWSGSDGAAGRMTAQAGLHNLPAELRPAVRAEAGHVFVRADLGQIEPRVLAAVSGDRVLAQATQADDLYRPVADRLGVERAVAKVAVLAAMYGQTSGTAGRALQGLDRAYPVAMQFLRDAEQDGKTGVDIHTYGGRRVRMGRRDDPDLSPDAERSAAAAMGRYARNASVQGAAAEVFKAWAATLRARLAGTPATIVLCLHDELLVHAPTDQAPAVADLLHSSLDEASGRWFRGSGVRFVAEVSTVASWADAKG